MPIGAIIAGGASLIGGLASSGAATDAASIQAGAADKAAQVQQNEFNQTQTNLAPWMGAGQNALAQLLWQMGIGPQPGTAPATPVGPSSPSNLGASLTDPTYGQGTVAVGAPSGSNPIGTTTIGGQQYQVYQQPGGLGPADPFTGFAAGLPGQTLYVPMGGSPVAGVAAGAGAPGLTTPGGFITSPFTQSQFQQSPGYQWQLGQGIEAATNSAAARGGVVGGNTLKDLMTFGQGLANQDWWNAYNANQQQKNTLFNQLFSISGAGQNAAANLGSLGSQTAGNIGNAMIGAGNASAAGVVGSANALNSGLSSAGNNYLLYSMLNNQNGGGGSWLNPDGGVYGWSQPQ